MKTSRWGATLGVVGVLLGFTAGAQEAGAEAVPAGAPVTHRITAYVHSGVGFFLSDFRTMGGIGGGLGVRDTLDERYILQADARYLVGLGNAVELRAGAGVQRRGLWTPAALVTLSGMMGGGMRFMTPARSTPVRAPALAVGLQLAPLRFTHAGTQLSLFEVGLGVGTEWPGTGVSLHLTLLQAGTSF